MPPILCTTDLSIGYRSKNQENVIQTHLNLQLHSGRLTSLLGINGIGKSTLLRTLTGSQPALEGQILLDGTPLKKQTREAIAQKISIVLTERLSHSQLHVRELIALGRIPYTNWIGKQTQSDDYHIEEALQLTDIKHLEHQKISNLSDGQMQKVLIARAIAQDTPIIILDEPSTHLDLYHKINLFRLLKKLCVTQNKCILFSTHDMDLALQVSDDIIALKPQEALQGPTDELIEKGVFDNFFQDENIHFDALEKRFKIQIS